MFFFFFSFYTGPRVNLTLENAYLKLMSCYNINIINILRPR